MPDTRLFPVKEFAQFVHMPASTIRYYSRLGLLPPAMRGSNNYQYYSKRQIVRLNVIRTFQELGVPLSDMLSLINQRTPQSVVDLLSNQEKVLNSNITRWAGARNILQTLYDMILPVLNVKHDDIIIEKMPEKRILLGNKNDYSKGKDAYDALFSFYDDINMQYPNLCFHFPVWGVFGEDTVKRLEMKYPERYYIYSPFGKDIIPEHLYAIGYLRGGYGNGAALYKKMLMYIDEQGFEVCGNAYEEYPVNEIFSSDETQYLMRVTIAVCKKHGVT